MTNKEKILSLVGEQFNKWLDAKMPEATTSTDWSLFPNFQPSEFVCSCGKCNYSKAENVMDMDPKLLWILQAVRNRYKKSIKITCGVRCKTFNDSLPNAVANSYHLPTYKKAADFYIQGVTSSEAGRDEVVAFMKLLPGYKYAYHNKSGSSPLMGAAIHIEVK